MSFLKSRSSHLTCSHIIQKYLEGRENERVLAHNFINLYTEHDQKYWAEVMDMTRHSLENDTEWHGRRAVTYQHFIISPDPKDGVTQEMLMSLTHAWTQEFFGDVSTGEAGRLGNFEVAEIYHDDNERGISHAHVIVNNSDLETGRRLHLDRKENNLIADHLQELAKEYGLTYFDNTAEKPERITRGAFITRTERELMRKESFSWKQDLRDKINVAKRLSSDETGFIKRLSMLGVTAEKRDDDYLYKHAKNENRWQAYGYRLGRNYTSENIAYEQEISHMKHAVLDDKVVKNVETFIENVGFERIALLEGDTTVHDIAHALKVNDRYNIRSLKDYGVRLKTFEATLEVAQRGGSGNATGIEKICADLRKTKETVKDCGLFEGIKPQQESRSRKSKKEVKLKKRNGNTPKAANSGSSSKARRSPSQTKPNTKRQ